MVSFLSFTTSHPALQVVPFLVLAVGVDNIFIIVQTWQREEKGKTESIEDHVSRVVGKVGPTILLSTSAEALCFFLGTARGNNEALVMVVKCYHFSHLLNSLEADYCNEEADEL